MARHHASYFKAFQINWPISYPDMETQDHGNGLPHSPFKIYPALEDRVLNFRYPALWVFEAYHLEKWEALDGSDIGQQIFYDMDPLQRYFALHPYLNEIGYGYQSYTSSAGDIVAMNVMTFGHSHVRELCEKLQSTARAPMRMPKTSKQWCIGTRDNLAINDIQQKITQHAKNLPDLTTYPYDGQTDVPVDTPIAPPFLHEGQAGPAISIHVNTAKWPKLKVRKARLLKITPHDSVPVKIKELPQAPLPLLPEYGPDYIVFYPVQTSDHDQRYLASEGPLEYGQHYRIELIYRLAGTDHLKTIHFQTETAPSRVAMDEQHKDTKTPRQEGDSRIGCDVLWTKSINEDGEEVLYHTCSDESATAPVIPFY
ncbi:hypothetical protein [Parendozoicomonas haliclonae]|nr:hypothetical protein [Parendozoicomonas haliclonae]